MLISPLARAFFNRATVNVAQELLGCRLHFGTHRGIITETEAYVGEGDPACHAARGRTKRTEVMFGPAGMSYVYFIYGMYHCLNIVTEKEGFPAAVLIRGLALENGIHLNGPGKLCRALGIDLRHNALDITRGGVFYVTAGTSLPFHATPRIGIRKGQDKLWRFASDMHYKRT